MEAIVKNGVVINVIEGSLPDSIPCPPETGIGWTFDGTTWADPRVRSLSEDTLSALMVTDRVALRCFKAGVAFPAAWQTYTVALRNIHNGTDTTSIQLPTMPTYPAGT